MLSLLKKTSNHSIKKIVLHKKKIEIVFCAMTIYVVYNYTLFFHKVRMNLFPHYTLEGIKINGNVSEFYTKAILERNIRLSDVPWYMMTNDLCTLAMNLSKWNLQYVPDRFKTVKMCEDAISRFGTLLYYVPKRLRTQKMCEDAVSQYMYLLEIVPEHLKTKQMCEFAVEHYPLALQWVPESKNNYQQIQNILSSIYNETEIATYFLKGNILRQTKISNIIIHTQMVI